MILKSRVVNINHNAVVTDNGLKIGEPKTKRSIRKLPLSDYLYGELITYKTVQERYSRSYDLDMDLISPNTMGGIMNRSRLYSAVKQITKYNSELPQKLHPHSLRHTFVTLLIANGLDVVTVSSLAGDTVEIITKHYAHALKEREAMAMDKIGVVFANITIAPKIEITAQLNPLPVNK